MSGGIARKIRRHEVWHPTTIDIIVDVAHRTLQVVDVFGIPASDKCVVNGDADARICLSSFRQRQPIFPSNLAYNGNPVPRRSASGTSAVRPEVGDCFLLLRESLDDIVDFKSGREEV
jgi:hypothetical protein